MTVAEYKRYIDVLPAEYQRRINRLIIPVNPGSNWQGIEKSLQSLKPWVEKSRRRMYDSNRIGLMVDFDRFPIPDPQDDIGDQEIQLDSAKLQSEVLPQIKSDIIEVKTGKAASDKTLLWLPILLVIVQIILSLLPDKDKQRTNELLEEQNLLLRQISQSNMESPDTQLETMEQIVVFMEEVLLPDEPEEVDEQHELERDERD